MSVCRSMQKIDRWTYIQIGGWLTLLPCSCFIFDAYPVARFGLHKAGFREWRYSNFFRAMIFHQALWIVHGLLLGLGHICDKLWPCIRRMYLARTRQLFRIKHSDSYIFVCTDFKDHWPQRESISWLPHYSFADIPGNITHTTVIID